MNKFRSTLLTGRGVAVTNPLVADKKSRGTAGDDLSAVAIDRSEGRTADHREGDRHRLAGETISVRFKNKAHDAELVNLSGGGAMIRADFSPRLWERVDLQLGEGAPLESAVRWIRGDRIGVEFAHETRIEGDSALRDSILLDVIHRTFPDVEAVASADETQAEAAPAASAPDNVTPRTDRRHPLIWSGQLVFDHDAHNVRLRNISATGALVECATVLSEGMEVMLDLGNCVTQFAVVTWVRGDQAGLTFEGTFDLARLADAKPDVAPQSWSRPGFLDLAHSTDSPWAEEWDRPTLDRLRGDLEGYLGR
jgi:hypothetical protein